MKQGTLSTLLTTSSSGRTVVREDQTTRALRSTLKLFHRTFALLCLLLPTVAPADILVGGDVVGEPNLDPFLIIGNSTQGGMRITNGDVVTTPSGGVLGMLPGGSGQVIIGVNGRWAVTNGLVVGSEGSGDLRISQGGSVETDRFYVGTVPGGRGVVFMGIGGEVTASDNTAIGFNGSGTLFLNSGASIFDNEGNLGRFHDARGRAFVAGDGTLWHSETVFRVGGFGTGDLFLSQGGQVSSFNGFVGEANVLRSSVDIRDLGSKWTVRGGDLFVGGSGGHGTMTLREEGAVELLAGSLKVATEPESHGNVEIRDAGRIDVGGDVEIGRRGGSVSSFARVTVDEPGSTLTVGGNAYVANGGGIHRLDIEDGASMSVAGNFNIQTESGAIGRVRLRGEGSTLIVDGVLRVGGGSGIGVLDVGPGTTVVASSVVDEGIIIGDGTIVIDP